VNGSGDKNRVSATGIVNIKVITCVRAALLVQA